VIFTDESVRGGGKLLNVGGGERMGHPSQGDLQNLVPVLGRRNA
jgi:hypothetical protein